MIFITGPLYSGKRTFAQKLLGCTPEELNRRAVQDVQDLARDCPNLEKLTEELSCREIVIAVETGGGVVPVDPAERAAREAAGRLACLLAERAETVVRVFCGLPTVLKGELP